MKQVYILFLFLMSMTVAHANVVLPAIFADNMVLQQNSEITVWGWGKPYEQITVVGSWNNDTVKTITDNQANWKVTLNTGNAGGPYTLTVKGYVTIELKNILLGEVWLCSGQSNMEWSARLGIDNAQEEVAKANYPNIRFFTVNHRTALSPNFDVTGNWAVCSPETMIDFSAVAYFFAREVQKEINVPIGLINASWGGTPAEVWLPEASLGSNRVLAEAATKIPEMGWSPREAGRVYNAMIAPITPYKIAGVLWYQGETNVANPESYHTLFSTLINSWRQEWGYTFPFYYAQIAPFTYNESPTCGADIRNAQRQTLSVANTGMVVTADITADTMNIHPTNKQDVGKRFAHIALNKTYNKTQFAVSGPLYKSHKVKGNVVTIDFDYAQGLFAKSKITGFHIAGEDKQFKPADAVIKGTTIEVQSKQVAKPVYVRYSYRNASFIELFNTQGLPASTFEFRIW